MRKLNTLTPHDLVTNSKPSKATATQSEYQQLIPPKKGLFVSESSIGCYESVKIVAKMPSPAKSVTSLPLVSSPDDGYTISSRNQQYLATLTVDQVHYRFSFGYLQCKLHIKAIVLL